MKKKLLFIMPSLAGGGTEKVLIDILQNMDFEHYDVSLFLEFGEGVYINDVPVEVEVLSFYNRHTIWHDRLFRLLRTLHLYLCFHSLIYGFLFRRLLGKRKFDVILSFMEGNALKLHSYVTDKAKKNLSWVHIDLKQKHWSLDFFRNEKEEFSTYQKMDKVVFVSEDVKRRFLELYAIQSEKCTVIYNLIDKNAIQQSAVSERIEKRKFTICMVGRLNKQKRYDRALRVTKRLKDAGYDFDLWIIGEGSLEEPLKAMSNEYGLNECVHFLGFKKPSYSYMKVADLYLNTSEAEGFSLVNCEALCLGLPVISTATSGPTELLNHSQYGLLVPEKEEDIYIGVKRMIDDANLREEYSKKGIQRAEMFNVPNTMTQIYKILG
ncbi:glycosyltransferase [Phocaeicola dorei]|jgi:glycosyltransferase involved in cell wall biosynthesis|nr:glycosyltransferase [Phocaeicola dorei]